jgi:hypothetical protein
MSEVEKNQESNSRPQPTKSTGMPICPHCGADPCEIAMKPAFVPPKFIVGVIHCSNCRRVFGAIPMGLTDGQPRSGLFRPEDGMPPEGFRS